MASPPSKEVKCSFEWIPGSPAKEHVDTNSPTFTSQVEGTRKLEWQIGLRRAQKNVSIFDLFFSKGPNEIPMCLSLCLLTQIEDELDVKYSFSIKDCCDGDFFEDAGSYKFKSKDQNAGEGRTKGFSKEQHCTWVVTCEISYKDSIVTKPGEDETRKPMMKKARPIEAKGVKLIENHLDPQFTDLTLLVKGKEFRAHRVVLSARSPGLSAIFEYGARNNPEHRVEIEDLEPDTIQEMLNFIYTGRVPNLPKVAQELLVAADRYDLTELMTIVEDHLISNISLENAIKLLVLADTHCAANLYNAAIDFAAANVEELQKREDWRGMVENQPRLLNPIMSEVVKHLR